MIYFLVNNNYHLIDVYQHCEHLSDYDKSLIQIPHTLDVVSENKNFKDIFTFKTPFSGIKNYFNLLKIKKIERKIQSEININRNDILFVYTEYEVLNQYIISLFKKVSAKVFILNEGLATYLTYSASNEHGLSFKNQIKLFYTKYVLGYTYLEYLYYNGIVFPQINSKYIDGVLLDLDVLIKRNIKRFIIKKNVNELELNNNKAIFLSQDMYNFYCSKDEFSRILKDILHNMSNKFEKVYFKFHPREEEENKKWQIKIIQKFNNIEILEDKAPFENLIEQYQTKYVFSFSSTALLNVNSMGAIPVYIYHLYDSISKNSVFKQIDLILKNAEYKFINENYNLDNVGFVKVAENAAYSSLANFITNEMDK